MMEEPKMMEAADDDYERKEEPTISEEILNQLNKKQIGCINVKQLQKDWFEDFTSSSSPDEYSRYDRDKLANMNLGYIVISSVALGLSYLFANDKETLANPYTAYHVAMIRGFFGSIWCFCAFNLFRHVLYRLGKPRNPYLYMILEPFSIVLRLAVLYIFIVYGVWNRLPNALKLIFYST